MRGQAEFLACFFASDNGNLGFGGDDEFKEFLVMSTGIGMRTADFGNHYDLGERGGIDYRGRYRPHWCSDPQCPSNGYRGCHQR